MGKRTFIKFLKGCQITKVVRKGKSPRITMKCPKSVLKKLKSAQGYIDEA